MSEPFGRYGWIHPVYIIILPHTIFLLFSVITLCPHIQKNVQATMSFVRYVQRYYGWPYHPRDPIIHFHPNIRGHILYNNATMKTKRYLKIGWRSTRDMQSVNWERKNGWTSRPTSRVFIPIILARFSHYPVEKGTRPNPWSILLLSIG